MLSLCRVPLTDRLHSHSADRIGWSPLDRASALWGSELRGRGSETAPHGAERTPPGGGVAQFGVVPGLMLAVLVTACSLVAAPPVCAASHAAGAASPVGIGAASRAGGRSAAPMVRDVGRVPSPRALPEDSQPPEVLVLQPAGGEEWLLGSIQTIRWSAVDDSLVTSVDVDLARDGVNFADVVARDIPNSGALEWTVTPPVTGSARVRVRAKDVAGNIGVGISAAPFGITLDEPLYSAWTLSVLEGETIVAQVDPRRGAWAAVETLSINMHDPQLAGGPLGDNFYLLTKTRRYPANLLTLSNHSGEIMHSAPIAFPAGLVGLAASPLDGVVYSTVRTSFNQQLVTLDPVTGLHTFVGPLVFSPNEPGVGVDVLAFSQEGGLYGAQYHSSHEEVELWRIDPLTLDASLISAYPNGPYAVSGLAFLGDELWMVDDQDGLAVRLDPQTGEQLAVNQFAQYMLQGLAPHACLASSPYLHAADAPNDGGGHIDFEWTGYVPPPTTVRLEVVRALDACELTDPGLPALITLDVSDPAHFVDATTADYTAYYYGLRALAEDLPKGPRIDGGLKTKLQVLETVATGPAFSFPNLLINEFAPAGGIPKTGRSASGTGEGAGQGVGQRAGDGSAAGPQKIGEQVEIRNLASTDLDLTGFRLSNGPGDPTPDEETLTGIVPAGGLFVHTLGIISLPDAGGTLALLPPAGTAFQLDIVAYGTQGGAPTAPAGFTVNRVPGTGRNDPNAASFETGAPSFGAENSVATPALGQSIVLNEVVYTSQVGGNYVELYNPQGSAVVLDHFALSDGVSFVDMLSSQLRLDSGALTVLQQGAAGSFTHTVQSNLLYLYKVTDAGLLQRVDQLGWAGGPSVGGPPGDALSRTPDGLAVYLGNQGANWQDCGGGNTLVYTTRTPGTPNQDVRVLQRVVDPAGAGDFTTIQAALAAAGVGTRILVNAGTYAESIQLKNGVEIHGGGGNPSAVVITGAGGNLPIVTATGVNATAILAGVTLRGGSAPQGGGLLVDSGSPQLTNVRFEQCHATQKGGGAAVLAGSPTFAGCFFWKNTSSADGAALAVLGGSPVVRRCLFVRNDANGRGGAIFAGAGNTTVDHCVMDLNSARATGAGVVHSAGGFVTATYSLVTNDLEGAALKTEGGGAAGRVTFSCGGLFGHPAPLDMVGGGLDTSSVVMGDPQYCQPLAFNYAYASTSPLAAPHAGCGEIRGIEGPPCAQITVDAPAAAPPRVTLLHPASPNPFNPATVLRFDLAGPGRAELTLYDARGRRVAQLLEGGQTLEAGAHQIAWRGLDQRGRAVASGIYYAQLAVDGQAVGPTQRLVLLR
jgi:hypothetical protein